VAGGAEELMKKIELFIK